GASGRSCRDGWVAGAQEAGEKRSHRCPAASHAAVGRTITRVGDPPGACPGAALAGPVVLRVDGRTPRLAAAHPRPVVPPGLPADHGAAVADRPRRIGQRRTVAGGTTLYRGGAAAYRRTHSRNRTRTKRIGGLRQGYTAMSG